MEEKKKKIRQALEDFALTFASLDGDSEYWGHDTNLGKCEEEFELAIEEIIRIFRPHN